MKTLLQFLCILALCGCGWAQSTTVTGTITDTDGTAWTNGTYTVSLVPSPSFANSSYVWQGQPINIGVYTTGTMDGTGTITVSLPSTTAISPKGTQWSFHICPNASAQCFNYLSGTLVTGGSVNLSTPMSAVSIPPRFSPGAFSYGYADFEVVGPRNPGATYFNVSNLAGAGCFEVWNGSSWTCVGNGSSSGTVNPGAAFCFVEYLTTGSTVDCSPNLTETGGTNGILSYLGLGGVVAAMFTTNNTGVAGEYDMGCGTAATSPGAGVVGWLAPTTCTTGGTFALPATIGNDGALLGQASHSGTQAQTGFVNPVGTDTSYMSASGSTTLNHSLSVDSNGGAHDSGLPVMGVVYKTAAAVTMTTGTGLIGSPVTMVTPASNHHYMVGIGLTATTAGNTGTCSTGGIAIQLAWTDAYSTQAVSASNNSPITVATGAVMSAALSVSSTLSAATVGRANMMIVYVTGSTALTWQANESVGSNCTTPPVVEVDPLVIDLGY